MAHLTEQLLLMAKICGSNPAIGNFMMFLLLITVGIEMTTKEQER